MKKIGGRGKGKMTGRLGLTQAFLPTRLCTFSGGRSQGARIKENCLVGQKKKAKTCNSRRGSNLRGSVYKAGVKMLRTRRKLLPIGSCEVKKEKSEIKGKCWRYNAVGPKHKK